MASYKKVFFYPWVGPEYEKGINFDNNGRLIFKEPDGWYDENGEKISAELKDKDGKPLEPLHTAVYGKEHYCDGRTHCEHKNFEQHFYLHVLTPATLGQLQDPVNVAGYIDQLAHFHALSVFNNINWKDKFYVLHKDHYWPFCKIQKHFKLSFADLCLYTALEKILTIHSLWEKPLSRQAAEVVKIVQNIQGFTNEAAKHHFCPMHMEFTCPVCHEEKFTCTHCEQLPICRYQTQRQLSGYSTEMEEESDSHKPFREALGNTPKIWKHLLFSNFYQRGKAQTTGNPQTEVEQAVSAFAEVIKENQPEIIITWGKDLFNTIATSHDLLQSYGITMRHLGSFTPRIYIEGAKTIPSFTILDWDEEGKSYHCLVLTTYYHPSAGKFDSAEAGKYIRCAFADYTNLINWQLSPVQKIISEILQKEAEKPSRQKNVPPNVQQEFTNQANILITNGEQALGNLLNSHLNNNKPTWKDLKGNVFSVLDERWNELTIKKY